MLQTGNNLSLAERRGDRGSYIVIDGKQRLLALSQFAGLPGSSPFHLRGLSLHPDLRRITYKRLQEDPSLRHHLNAFENQTIRTVVVRNWPDESFLYAVFYRLNTGSVQLSPQELRQALHPGPFVDYIDDFCYESLALKAALGISKPDYRMRDAEIATRYFGFTFFLSNYAGNLKRFLDDTCFRLNNSWAEREDDIRNEGRRLEAAIEITLDIFGESAFRRYNGIKRQYDRRFHRAVFEMMTFYFSNPEVGARARDRAGATRTAFEKICTESALFNRALESTTKSLEATARRLQEWGQVLSVYLGMKVEIPRIERKRLHFRSSQ